MNKLWSARVSVLHTEVQRHRANKFESPSIILSLSEPHIIYRKYYNLTRQNKASNLRTLASEGPWSLRYFGMWHDVTGWLVPHIDALTFRSRNIHEMYTKSTNFFIRLFVALWPDPGSWPPLTGLRDCTHWIQHTQYDSSGRVISPTQRPLSDNTQHSQETNIHDPSGIRNRITCKRATADPRLKPLGHWDGFLTHIK
jgi:hypothetical protein